MVDCVTTFCIIGCNLITMQNLVSLSLSLSIERCIRTAGTTVVMWYAELLTVNLASSCVIMETKNGMYSVRRKYSSGQLAGTLALSSS